MTDEPAILDQILLQTGRLNYVWTNTESVLIHIMAGLLGTDKERAVVVFLTLNTTRARVDLVERLAKMKGRSPDERDAILAATRKLVRLSGLRNHYNHCIYSFDTENGSARTILMRIADRKTDIRMGRSEMIDETGLRRIDEAIKDVTTLNLEFWHLVKAYGYPV
ncbi:hypothetical protein [Qingshengfaniella alkalisoli]|uniref:Uncharacterized protein n=1 Tax=Qingshengfaniella alkalisoli TaxID=2599296 RepID=A0A5B8I9W1_9RHOB|nr:hypothetical protein [Qingshengfaniella alkalisoli]QDY70789.1 hypothetical protein FPZ52_13830 [Qingshengfaniella alkalisoli]